ncbi:NADPH-dependent FMN reductase [Rhodobacter veldkampii DSM 11550]|uniref:NADPH-dependent FMN reductase n=1 Tax=Phaeovulum veldkampii DSM 11550 TaxID=1185920 RepID=A0A2T4JLL2_9RHOB|nr:NADPH-dependent FMN reductase [Phaeovulum veldkampii]MBK5946647.1 NADPH-dependent FMN reductase [Phaeovulum veldkampii DSM 11550]PTE18799.1 NADPH-dependent FMN reductase [Phaeovulum veldkampii DSM 11550]TDQ59982.1 chromate reductase [Phaeovulum veldkampii DSM 11550]
MAGLKLAGLCGSLRSGSSNRLLLAEAVRAFGPADYTEADLRLPLYDADLEATGMPEPVTRLAALLAAADAVVIASPEYNKAPSGVLKNALDWVSRVQGAALAGKPVAIISAAAGRSGGERGQYALRLCLVPFRARVLTAPEVLIAGANTAFDAEGRLADPKADEFLGQLMADLRAEAGRQARAGA